MNSGHSYWLPSAGAAGEGNGIGFIPVIGQHPEGVIKPGEQNSNISDFRPQNGLWLPVYDPSSNQSLTFDSNGYMTYAKTGARSSSAECNMNGVVSKFRLFLDATGELQFRFRLDSIAWSGSIAGSKCCIGATLFNTQLNTVNNRGFVWGIGPGNNTDQIWILGGSCFHWQYWPTSLSISANTGVQYGLLSDMEMRLAVKWDAALSTEQYAILPADAEYNFHLGGGWQTAAWAGRWNAGYNCIEGLKLYLGFTNLATLEVFTARLVEFELLKGYMAYSPGNAFNYD